MNLQLMQVSAEADRQEKNRNIKNIEYDKPHASNIKRKDAGRQRMKEIKKDVDCGDRTVRAILQFPDEPQDAVAIRKSVKSILMMELEEQMKAVSAGENRKKD